MYESRHRPHGHAWGVRRQCGRPNQESSAQVNADSQVSTCHCPHELHNMQRHSRAVLFLQGSASKQACSAPETGPPLMCSHSVSPHDLRSNPSSPETLAYTPVNSVVCLSKGRPSGPVPC